MNQKDHNRRRLENHDGVRWCESTYARELKNANLVYKHVGYEKPEWDHVEGKYKTAAWVVEFDDDDELALAILMFG